VISRRIPVYARRHRFSAEKIRASFPAAFASKVEAPTRHLGSRPIASPVADSPMTMGDICILEGMKLICQTSVDAMSFPIHVCAKYLCAGVIPATDAPASFQKSATRLLTSICLQTANRFFVDVSAAKRRGGINECSSSLRITSTRDRHSMDVRAGTMHASNCDRSEQLLRRLRGCGTSESHPENFSR